MAGRCLAIIFCLLIATPLAGAAWFDDHWQFRRFLEVNWDADHADGGELATAQFYTAGHEADGTDVRVTSDDGHIVASHVLGVGPGDQVRLVFALVPHQTRYYVYFANPDPAPPPAGTEDVQYQGGLLLEMRQWRGKRTDTAAEILADWDQAAPVIGQTMIDRLFYAGAPFGIQPNPGFLTKVTGTLSVPADADYHFIGSVEGKGVVCIDGTPTWFIPNISKEAIFRATLPLRHGRHAFVLYCGQTSQMSISIAWQRPDMKKLEVLPRNLFGFLGHAQPGPLEERGKTLTADFQVKYLAEAFVADNYSHRYLLSAQPPATGGNVKYDWDLGDGLTAGGPQLEHVYVTAGVYPIRLTVHAGDSSDTQTTRLAVDRDWDNVDQPTEDPPFVQARIIGSYDVWHVIEPWLPWMALIEHEAGLTTPQTAAAQRMAELPRHLHPDICLTAMQRLSHDLEVAGDAEQAAKLWDRVPADSDLQPAAVANEAGIFLWWLADFPDALRAAQRVVTSTDPIARRANAQALILSGQTLQGKKILDDLQEEQEKAGVHLAAVSGAMARDVEFCLDQDDWETGEQNCQTWETRCPAAFLEGYEVVLRTSLMQRKPSIAPGAAAKVAEAFANAVPDSPYAPELLDHASRWLARIDPVKSRQLRDTLRARYPEDQLSQTPAATQP